MSSRQTGKEDGLGEEGDGVGEAEDGEVFLIK
jgi:hypothetical protein